ncbi:flagellar assembly protein FliH [Gracilibacillus halophilus]|uniref:flagellar assembly protein FliH n=1 Tax=Gracilibacillus halophilus TaxID=470864 RepID=UPI0014613CBE|nr:flagellar assembly protein FliH [Gracilibacillus halophilus]
MSNASTRKIAIKPIQTLNIEKEPNQSQEDFQDIQDQIKEAKQQLRDVKQQIEEQKKAANEEIDQMKQQWEEERQADQEKAQQEGYQQGFEQGKNDSVKQYEAFIQQGRDVVRQANQDYEDIIQKSESSILEIALEVAEKIVYHSLSEDHELYTNMVRRAINQVMNQTSVEIYCVPAHYQKVLDNKEELMHILHQRAELSIYPDEQLQEGQVIIETPYGKIDASVDTQLEEIRYRLAQVVEEMTREQTSTTG